MGFKISLLVTENQTLSTIQLAKLSKLPGGREIVKNTRQTFRRLKKSDNPKIDFAANLRNTITGTMSSNLMERFTDAEAKKVIIEWLPSSSKEPDPIHQTHYGQRMTLYRARKLGLGTRYGCHCGFRVIRNDNIVKGKVNA